MYTEFYGLSAFPFLLTPDPRFFFESTLHHKAMAHLMVGLEQGEGVVVITGDIGAGKSTLVGRLLDILDPATYLVARVMTTHLKRDDLLRARDEALLDALTGVLNRKGFDRRLDRLLSEQPAGDAGHGLVMLDIDHFKQVNDTHGHLVGDRVIQAVGEILRAAVPAGDCAAARYGGEEFAILVPNATLDRTAQIAEDVRLRTKAMKIRDRRTQDVVLTITISGGVAAWRPGDDAAALVQRADAALYQSKKAGRDRVTRA